MKPIPKELLLLSAIVFSCLLCKFILVPLIAGNSALDINLHDTYYISTPHSVLWIIIFLTCFAVYLFRAVYTRFTNTTVLVILMLSTLCIIGWLSILMQAFNLYHYVEEMRKQLAEQDQNNAPVKGLFYGSDISASDHYVLTVLQVLLALFVGFIGMRIGMNLKVVVKKNSHKENPTL